MNASIIKDLEAKASMAGLFSCPTAELDRRIAKWDQLMKVTPDAILKAALDDLALFEYWLAEPVFEAGIGLDRCLNDPQGN